MNRESASQKLSDSPTHELSNYGGYSDVASFIASATSRRKRA